MDMWRHLSCHGVNSIVINLIVRGWLEMAASVCDGEGDDIRKEGLHIKWGGHMWICGGTPLATGLIQL